MDMSYSGAGLLKYQFSLWHNRSWKDTTNADEYFSIRKVDCFNLKKTTVCKQGNDFRAPLLSWFCHSQAQKWCIEQTIWILKNCMYIYVILQCMSTYLLTLSISYPCRLQLNIWDGPLNNNFWRQVVTCVSTAIDGIPSLASRHAIISSIVNVDDSSSVSWIGWQFHVRQSEDS